MTTLPEPLCRRKDIASYLGLSVRQVQRNEKRLDLHLARRDLNCRCVLYRTDMVIRIFKVRFFDPL